MKKSFLKWILLVTVAAGLTACGGGGGGNTSSSTASTTSTGTSTSSTTTGTTATTSTGTTSSATPTITVNGRITYERVPSNASGSLNYSAITTNPARGVTVELYSNSNFVTRTTADASGNYSFSAPVGNTSIFLRAIAELKKTTGTGQWNIVIADNTQSNAAYAMSSTAIAAGTGTVVQNLNAISGWSNASSSYSLPRVAAPFALADTFYTNMQKVLSVAPSTVFPALNVYWSINNLPSQGNPALGQIGTSYFTSSAPLGGAITSRSMYILGYASTVNADTDEYDESVVSHEWGHYYQSVFSRNDSPGGSHSSGGDDRQDRRLSFGEGWGTAWSGIALDNNSYKDSFGSNQALGFTVALNSGYASTPKGWMREKSVLYVLWSIAQQAGFAGVHSAMTSTAFKNGVGTADIYGFAAAYRTLNPGTPTTALNTLLTAESINSGSDAFGNNETVTGGNSASLPFYRATNSSGICVSNANDASNVGNKIGRYVYVRFTTASAGTRTITVNGTAGSDPDYEIYSNGIRVAYEIDSGTSESGSVSLAAGEHLLIIWDDANTNACFTVSVL